MSSREARMIAPARRWMRPQGSVKKGLGGMDERSGKECGERTPKEGPVSTGIASSVADHLSDYLPKLGETGGVVRSKVRERT